MRFMALIAGVVSIAVIATGCGSGDEEPLTKAEFAKQADEICKQQNEQLRKEFNSFLSANAKQDGKEKGEEVVRQIVAPNYEEQVEELQELEPPSGDEEQVEALLAEFESEIEAGRKQPETLLGFDEWALQNTLTMAEKYGLEECGR
jgi:hypothetical protein